MINTEVKCSEERHDGVGKVVKCLLFSPSVTSVSNSISQEGELALEDDSSVCDDIFLIGQVREGETPPKITLTLHTVINTTKL